MRRTCRLRWLRKPVAAVVAPCVVVLVVVTGTVDHAAAGRAQSTNAPPPVGDGQVAYPHRAVPGYATYTGWRIRTSAGGGSVDFVASIPTGTASTPVYGDWDGNGTFTPGYFLNGRWVLYDRMIGVPVAWRSFSYGRTGDAAVVGDWNRDGRTDIGVFRRGTWFQRDAANGGPSSRSFVFGSAGDRPLAGDWDGNASDTVGLRRSNVVYLRNANSAGPYNHKFSFGKTTDTAVTGDWDGNRTDTVGVVRGTSWFLSSGHAASAPTTEVAITSGAAGYALPYPSPAGPSGDSCPTMPPGRTLTAWSYVRAPQGLSQPMPDSPLLAALLDAQKTMLGVEYDRSFAARTTQKYLNVRADSTSQELAIRSAAMSTLTVAIGMSMDGYDNARVGRDRGFALGYVDWLLRSVACQHRAVSPGGWGHTVQSAMWAGFAGFAAWLVWNDLPPQTRAYVGSVVADEANWVASRPDPYWKNESGSYLPGRAGNSAAEEAAWDAGHMGLAIQMLAGHPQAGAWTRKGTQLGIVAYSTQADTRRTNPVNGVALRTRLAGFNAYDDGTVENHGGIHADYISVAQYAWWSTIYAGVAGRALPQGFVHNNRLAWRATTKVVFPSPPFAAPGGTIYRSDGTIYYPQIADWGVLRYPQWLAYDATANLVAADVDPASGTRDQPPALSWLDLHTAKTRQLQQRHADGHIYEPGEERYARAEQLNAQLIAMGWAVRYADTRLPEVAVSTALVPLP
jgi:hypothetical protein